MKLLYPHFLLKIQKHKNSIQILDLIFLSSFFLIFNACTSTKPTKKPEPIIATIGNEPLYLSEFKYAYEKSMGTDYSSEKVENYLDLYINFKLKIIEAQELGLDEEANFQKELDSYKEQLSKPYLTDKEEVDKLVKEAYERLKEEVNVSHILIKISTDAEPEDTLLAYNQIRQIRQEAIEGKSFENLAMNYSEDMQSKNFGGNIGYFTALQMVYNFEDMAYNTEVGNISNLLRTRFGYHIIRVIDKRSTSGKVATAHIMVHLPKGATKQDSIQAKRKIDEIYQKIQKGEDWDKLCSQFSDDINSRDKGGVLPAFGIGTVIPAFEAAAFALEKPDDISEPVLSSYGWHIIKLIEKQEILAFEELKPYLVQKVSQDSRYEITRQSMITKLQLSNNFVENQKNIEQALSQANADLLKGDWDFSPNFSALGAELFSFENKTLGIKKSYSIQEFFEYVYQRQVPRTDLKTPSHYMKVLYDKFVEKSTFDFERNLLEEKYPEYKLLVNEYKEGMLLFQIMNDKVWNKALVDTVGAKKFYEKNVENYKWDSRAELAIFDCSDNFILQSVKDNLEVGVFPVEDISFEKIYFSQNDIALNNNADLGRLSKLLKENPDLVLEIVGHADPAENTTLADSRAKKVRNYLQNKGIDISRMIIKNFGNTKPISKTDRKQNRRVEFSFYSKNLSVLETNINQDNALNLKIKEGIYEQKSLSILSEIAWKEGEYLVEKDGRVFLIQVKKVMSADYKTFQETKGKVITDYQSFLEKEWLEELRQKYPIEVNQKTLELLLTQE